MSQDIVPLVIALTIVIGFGLVRLRQHQEIQSVEGKKQAKPGKPDNRKNRKNPKGRRLHKSGETYLKRVK